jgi:chaperonin GroES
MRGGVRQARMLRATSPLDFQPFRFRLRAYFPNPRLILGDHMKIKPLHDKILVKRVNEEDKTKGGIIIPDTAKEKPMEGKVIAVGAGKVLKDGTKRPLVVKEGDRILFAKYAGTEIKIDGEEHMIMSEEEVLGVVTDK